MAHRPAAVPIAHVDDEAATADLVATLEEVHGPPYDFAVTRWDGPTTLEPAVDRVTYLVVVETEDSTVAVNSGDPVRGPPSEGPYRRPADGFPTATDSHTAAVWPGDVVVLRPDDEPLELTGTGAAFAVRTEETAYPAPRVGFLRNVADDAAGCAEYEGAFRREVLPPEPSGDDEDVRGVNRVNQHTVDMRHDRTPKPVQHCHAPVATGGDRQVNHTETAIVLDRSIYDLPPVADSDPHVRLFRQPHADASDWVDVPLEPGSIVTTPATAERAYGHCFLNTFASLVAVPSFTAPLVEIGRDRERSGETHRKYHE